ncbi:MAG TPA: response regulator [Blastocatellia bacterium]|nr:response regulator [Blastocatellia bacterium]
MSAIHARSATTKRILYIEYNEDCCQMLAALLGYAGYEVDTAATVAAGLRLTRRERFDLLILGSRYPDGTGVELCRKLRAFDPDIPIVFYSSAAYEADIQAGLAAGAQVYLTKPLGVKTIEQTIAGLLGGMMEARLYENR